MSKKRKHDLCIEEIESWPMNTKKQRRKRDKAIEAYWEEEDRQEREFCKWREKHITLPDQCAAIAPHAKDVTPHLLKSRKRMKAFIKHHVEIREGKLTRLRRPHQVSDKIVEHEVWARGSGGKHYRLTGGPLEDVASDEAETLNNFFKGGKRNE